MGKSFDMNYVNCALLVVVLIVVVVCCMTKSNSPAPCVPVEGFYGRRNRVWKGIGKSVGRMIGKAVKNASNWTGSLGGR